MLLSEMPRSICNIAEKKTKTYEIADVFLISKVIPLYHDLSNLTLLPHCNNIQTEDNCWVHAHVQELIGKTGHGMACVTHDNLQAYHLGCNSKMELSDVNAGGQFCLDSSVLTEGPLFAAACQEQLSDMKAHQCVNRFRVMKCQFLANDEQ